jgi:hypothetical protein
MRLCPPGCFLVSGERECRPWQRLHAALRGRHGLQWMQDANRISRFPQNFQRSRPRRAARVQNNPVPEPTTGNLRGCFRDRAVGNRNHDAAGAPWQLAQRNRPLRADELPGFFGGPAATPANRADCHSAPNHQRSQRSGHSARSGDSNRCMCQPMIPFQRSALRLSSSDHA